MSEIIDEIEKAKSVYSGYGSSERYEKLLLHLDQALTLSREAEAINKDLLEVCEAALEFIGRSNKTDWNNEITPVLEAAIAKAKKERGINMSEKYILDGHKPIPCDDLMVWAKWFETADREVAKTSISDEITVSTVFLGLNHNHGDVKPLLFETMIFGGELDEQIERYSTWEEAEKGHKRWVAKAK